MSKNVNSCNWQQAIEECEYYEIDTEELNKLDQFLRTRSLPSGCTSVAMADGFLTALVIGPVDCCRQPNQGLELVWGEMPSNPSKAGKMSKQKQWMEYALSRRLRTLSWLLEHHREEYAPLIDTRTANILDVPSSEMKIPPIIEWCRGFMKFVDIDPQAWRPIFDTEAGRTLITPFIYFGTGDDWRQKMQVKYDIYTYDKVFNDHLQYFVFSIKDLFCAPYFLGDMYWFHKKIAGHWSVPTKYLQTRVAVL
jgi:yecA family protein